MPLTPPELRKIRTLIIIAIFSDDDLMDTLVLKGGNALEIGYGIVSRGSADLDFSMRQDFSAIGLDTPEKITGKFGRLLSQTFEENKFPYIVHDIRFKEKPRIPDPVRASFWGGYELTTQ